MGKSHPTQETEGRDIFYVESTNPSRRSIIGTVGDTDLDTHGSATAVPTQHGISVPQDVAGPSGDGLAKMQGCEMSQEKPVPDKQKIEDGSQVPIIPSTSTSADGSCRAESASHPDGASSPSLGQTRRGSFEVIQAEGRSQNTSIHPLEEPEDVPMIDVPMEASLNDAVMVIRYSPQASATAQWSNEQMVVIPSPDSDMVDVVPLSALGDVDDAFLPYQGSTIPYLHPETGIYI